MPPPPCSTPVQVFEGNAGAQRGGGIWATEDVIIHGATLTSNTASRGAGIAIVFGGLQCFNCTFLTNAGDVGGGLYVYASHSAVHGGNFTLNTATTNGGGAAYVQPDGAGAFTIVIDSGSQVVGNSAGTGAGVGITANSETTASVTGVSFIGNVASVSGGGFLFTVSPSGAQAVRLSLAASTFVGNAVTGMTGTGWCVCCRRANRRHRVCLCRQLGTGTWEWARVLGAGQGCRRCGCGGGVHLGAGRAPGRCGGPVHPRLRVRAQSWRQQYGGRHRLCHVRTAGCVMCGGA